MDGKERIQYTTAVVMLLSGIVISFIGFFTAPVGVISDSVLWYTAQALIYAGSIFGVGIYIDSRFRELSRKTKDERRKRFNLEDYQQ